MVRTSLFIRLIVLLIFNVLTFSDVDSRHPRDYTVDRVIDDPQLQSDPIIVAECIMNCMSQVPTRFVCDRICGSDGITYQDRYHFNCAVNCGRDVQFQYRGFCHPREWE